MGLLGALALGAAALVIGAGIAFVCDQLSQNEIRRQESLRNEYRDYQRKKQTEYQEACQYYETLRNHTVAEYSRAVSDYYKKLIVQRKRENRATFDKMMSMYHVQYTEKEKLLNECRNIVNFCKDSIDKQQNTYVRFKSIKSTLVSLQEAVYKLEAYLRYLENYKQNLNYSFETEGEILEPFSMTLPKDYPYEGKVLYLMKDRFQNYALRSEEAGYIKLDKSDRELFDNSEDDQAYPFMFYLSRNGQQYLSLAKGLLKNSIGGSTGIDTEVEKIFSKTISLRFKGHEFLPIKIDRRDLLSQQRRTPIGSTLHVYIKDYDFALKNTTWVSEKVNDGLSIASFGNIILLQDPEEYQQLFDYLQQNNLLYEKGEWRIGPIWGDNQNLKGIIMQLGNYYACRALFEDILEDRLVLRYHGLLPNEQLMSFDDVFINANVTMDSFYTPDQILKNPNQYENYFEECQKLQLYLVGEFLTQSQMMVKSPMSVYLDQWMEITNRLVDYLSHGDHIRISVLEWEYFSIKKICVYTFLTIDKPELVTQFFKQETNLNRRKFFIEFQEEDVVRIPCIMISDDTGTIKIRVDGNIKKNTLIDNGFDFDVYSVAVPYAEKQQLDAFSMFKEGRVASTEVKTAILNASSLYYKDNGYRINDLFNKHIQTNAKQLDSVVRAFSEERFFIIQGPPGTGKTTVIKELVLQQLKWLPKSRILIVSQANVAVDNVLRGIADISKTCSYIETSQIVRCGSSEKIAEDVECFSFDQKYQRYLDHLNDIPQSKEIYDLRKKWLDIIRQEDNRSVVGECLLSCFQIIGATCVGLQSRRYGLSSMNFDLVIIDEAGKALAGELLIPINHAKKVIIIGDHKQLPPVINTALYKRGNVKFDDVVEEQEQIDFLNRSFFERLYEDCPDHLKCMLDVQYRMPPVISDLVNIFYDGKLKNGANCYQKVPMFCGNHLLFVDMKSESEYREIDHTSDGNGISPYNDKEVEATVAVVRKIRTYYKERIVVITPYKRQKYKLQEGLKQSECHNVWVNTIDAFQGDEENVVIYCTTRAVKPTRYFSDAARLNVAFSRSKNTLIFLGSSDYLNSYPEEHILRKVSDYLMTNARIIQYREWLQEDFDLRFIPVQKNSTDEIVPVRENVQKALLTFSDFIDQLEPPAASTELTCKACGKELKKGENILCAECIMKYETHKCKCCGSTMYFSFYNKYVHGDTPADLCENCDVAVCSECGNEFYIRNEHKEKLLQQNKKLLCNACFEKLNRIVYRHNCDACGKEITLTYAKQKKLIDQGKNLPTICYECYRKNNEMVTVGVCSVCKKSINVKRYFLQTKQDKINKDMHYECSQKTYVQLSCSLCNNMFKITFGEKKFFESHGLPLPKKCPMCRKKNRNCDQT